MSASVIDPCYRIIETPSGSWCRLELAEVPSLFEAKRDLHKYIVQLKQFLAPSSVREFSRNASDLSARDLGVSLLTEIREIMPSIFPLSIISYEIKTDEPQLTLADFCPLLLMGLQGKSTVSFLHGEITKTLEPGDALFCPGGALLTPTLSLPESGVFIGRVGR